MVQTYVVLPNACICFPGSVIQEWFSFRSTESSITLDLAQGWFRRNFLGFALSVVVEFQDYINDGEDHVFMGYDFNLHPIDFGEDYYSNEKCGVRLMYAERVEGSNDTRIL
ncbi:hypothetical protein ACOSQ4_009136 [Xanthoceras sorbifolium]